MSSAGAGKRRRSEQPRRGRGGEGEGAGAGKHGVTPIMKITTTTTTIIRMKRASGEERACLTAAASRFSTATASTAQISVVELGCTKANPPLTKYFLDSLSST